MRVVRSLENFDRADNDVVCFLAGPCPSSNKWRNDIISFLEGIEKDKTLTLDNLIIVDPFRKDWVRNVAVSDETLNEQIKWEGKMLQSCDILVAYFDKSKDEKDIFPMTLFELAGNAMGIKARFGNNKINYRVLAYAHPEFAKFNDLKFELETLTEKWKTPITLETTNKSIMTLASKILESYVKIAK